MSKNTNKSSFQGDYKKLFNITLVISAILLIALVSTIIYFSVNYTKNPAVRKYHSNTPYVHVTDRKTSIILDETNTTIKPYLGEGPVMLLMWASWCPNCTSETPAITRIINENPDKKIIVLSHDDSKLDVENYVNSNNLNWYIIYNSDRSIRAALDPEANVVPITYVLDKDGNILNKTVGRLEYSEFNDLINEYMK